MTTVEEAKKRGPERHLTNKYNYAGPGTFFKARQAGSDVYEKLMKDAGRPLVGTKPYNKPINKLDTCAVDAKLAVESTGLVRKGSLAAGGSAHATLGKKSNSTISIGKKSTSFVKRGLKTR